MQSTKSFFYGSSLKKMKLYLLFTLLAFASSSSHELDNKPNVLKGFEKRLENKWSIEKVLEHDLINKDIKKLEGRELQAYASDASTTEPAESASGTAESASGDATSDSGGAADSADSGSAATSIFFLVIIIIIVLVLAYLIIPKR